MSSLWSKHKGYSIMRNIYAFDPTGWTFLFLSSYLFTVILVIQNYKWPFQTFLQRTLGGLHSIKNSGLNFRGISYDEWNNSFPEFPEKRTTSSQIFGHFSARILCSISLSSRNFLQEFPESYKEMKYLNWKNVDSSLCYFCEKRVLLTRAVFAGSV